MLISSDVNDPKEKIEFAIEANNIITSLFTALCKTAQPHVKKVSGSISSEETPQGYQMRMWQEQPANYSATFKIQIIATTKRLLDDFFKDTDPELAFQTNSSVNDITYTFSITNKAGLVAFNEKLQEYIKNNNLMPTAKM